MEGKCKFHAPRSGWGLELRASLAVSGALLQHGGRSLAPEGGVLLLRASLSRQIYFFSRGGALSASNDQHLVLRELLLTPVLVMYMRVVMTKNWETKGGGGERGATGVVILWQDWCAAPFFHSTLASGFIL